MPITPYTGTFGKKELVHLLKRTTFGAKQSDIDFFTGMSLSQVVEALLDTTEPSPSPPLKDYGEATDGNPDTAIAPGTTWVNDLNTGGQVNAGRRNSYKKWWLGLMLNQAPTIREKLTLFWVNHFGNEAETVRFASLLYNQGALLRASCMGDFKQMVKDMTLDPAMLLYLNGYLNNRFAPDENYARELQELFTLGKDDAVAYTEGDVQAAAKVLTGWTIDEATGLTVYYEALHDASDKEFSAYYGETIEGDNTASGGMTELDALLDMIFLKDEVAKFIVRKLYRWFVYYEITPQIEADVIVPLANTFRSNYQIRPVLVELFNSAHFFDTVISQGAVIKAPTDFMIGSLREFNVQYPPAADWASNYELWGLLGNFLFVIGQDLHNPPNVAGYPAYYQAPSFHELWINSDTITRRNEVTDFLVYIGTTINGYEIKFDLIAFVDSLTNPSDPNQLIVDALEVMYSIDLSQAARDQIKQDILLSGQTDDSYWTIAWLTYKSDPNNASYELIIRSRLQSLFKHFMNLEEYQLS